MRQIGQNLWRDRSGKHYRLHGSGITPNGCWIVAPVMRELLDIDIATGEDVYGESEIRYSVSGGFSAQYHYVTTEEVVR